MDFKIVKAGLNDSNRRLDKILRIYINNLPLSQIYKYLRKGLIKLNGKKAKPESKVLENDEISIAAFILQDNEISANKENARPNQKIKNDFEDRARKKIRYVKKSQAYQDLINLLKDIKRWY